MWWRALGVLCWAHCVCVSRTAVCGVLGEGVLRGYVVWLCIWRVLLVYCAVCCVNESTRQWGVPECGHSHKRHAHLGPGSEKAGSRSLTGADKNVPVWQGPLGHSPSRFPGRNPVCLGWHLPLPQSGPE